MSATLAPGFCAWVSVVAIEFSVVLTESRADEAVARTDCPTERASFDAFTTPLSAVSCAAIAQYEELSAALPTLSPVDTWFCTVASDCCVFSRARRALRAAELFRIEFMGAFLSKCARDGIG